MLYHDTGKNFKSLHVKLNLISNVKNTIQSRKVILLNTIDF